MQGKIESIEIAKWNDTTFYKVKVEGNTKEYSCWQKEFASIKVGDTVEFKEEEKNGRWRMIIPAASKGGGGGRPRSPEEIENQLRSFAMSYAKDITIAFINKEVLSVEKAEVYLGSLAEKILKWFKK